VAVCAGIVLPLARRRLRLPPAASVAAVAAAPLGLTVAAARSRKRDTALYVLQMWAFIVIHELPYDDPTALEQRVRVEYPIAWDEVLGLGVQPTVRLQRILGRAGRATALDHALVYVHWAWFFQPHLAAAWILWRHPATFGRTAALMAAAFDLGAIVYYVVPTAPPWWAAEHGRLEGVRRIMAEVGKRFWGRFWQPLYDFLGGNPVAAMPSLHFATSVMAAHVLSETGTAAGAAGWAYAASLGFALVYLGEHYLVDLLAGLALTEGVVLAAPRVAPALRPLSSLVQELEARARS